VLVFGCCCVLPPGIGGIGWWQGWFGGTKIVVKDAVKEVIVKDKAVQFK
jgi:hypothetical protein